MEQSTYVTKSHMAEYVASLLRILRNIKHSGAVVLALNGDLGAGKTTLVQTLATTLGIVEPVVSPTFVVLKHYETTDDQFATLVHIDAYRLESFAETVPLQLTQVMNNQDCLICVEWPEKLYGTLTPSMTLTLENGRTEDERYITYQIHENLS